MKLSLHAFRLRTLLFSSITLSALCSVAEIAAATPRVEVVAEPSTVSLPGLPEESFARFEPIAAQNRDGRAVFVSTHAINGIKTAVLWERNVDGIIAPLIRSDQGVSSISGLPAGTKLDLTSTRSSCFPLLFGFTISASGKISFSTRAQHSSLLPTPANSSCAANSAAQVLANLGNDHVMIQLDPSQLNTVVQGRVLAQTRTPAPGELSELVSDVSAVQLNGDGNYGPGSFRLRHVPNTANELQLTLGTSSGGGSWLMTPTPLRLIRRTQAFYDPLFQVTRNAITDSAEPVELSVSANNDYLAIRPRGGDSLHLKRSRPDLALWGVTVNSFFGAYRVIDSQIRDNGEVLLSTEDPAAPGTGAIFLLSPTLSDPRSYSLTTIYSEHSLLRDVDQQQYQGYRSIGKARIVEPSGDVIVEGTFRPVGGLVEQGGIGVFRFQRATNTLQPLLTSASQLAGLAPGSRLGTFDSNHNFSLRAGFPWKFYLNRRGSLVIDATYTPPTPISQELDRVLLFLDSGGPRIITRLGEQIPGDPTRIISGSFTDFRLQQNQAYLLSQQIPSVWNGTYSINEELLFNDRDQLIFAPQATLRDHYTYEFPALLFYSPRNGLSSITFADVRLASGEISHISLLSAQALGPNRLNDDGIYLAAAFNQIVRVELEPQSDPVCEADFNRDGILTLQDLFDFLSAWFSRLISADLNGDGLYTVQDIFDFLTRWFAGCA